MTKIMQELKILGQKLNTQTYGRLFLCGGAVRDILLKKKPKDFDCEVFHVTPTDFKDFLTTNNIKFSIEPNSKFPVIRFKLADEDIEVGFPRKENKTGSKHSDFEVFVVAGLSFHEACERRDFTMNALLLDVITCAIIDPLNGSNDIRNNVLKVCNPKTFREDSLRIIRAIQFIARFELSYENVLKTINQEMVDELKSLDPTSIWQEFEKMAHKGTTTGIGMALDFLLRLSTDFGLFPIFNKLAQTPQSKKHHKEGNVFNHTKLVVQYIETHVDTMLFFLSAFCHDMGKPEATKNVDGKITAYGHDKMTREAREFLISIGTPKNLTKQILVMVEHHMLNATMKPKTCYKLADTFYKVGLTLRDFMNLKIADNLGRITEDEENKLDCCKKLAVKFARLGILNNPLPKLINGHDILNIKVVDGIRVGDLLNEVRSLQFCDRIKTREEAIQFIEKKLKGKR